MIVVRLRPAECWAMSCADSNELSIRLNPPDRQSLAPRPTGVWVVEDQRSLCDMIAVFVQRLPGFRLVGASQTAEPALARAAAGDLDLVILDLQIPGMCSIDAMQQLAAQPIPPRVVVYSGRCSLLSVQMALAHGAFGYVVKSDSLDDFEAVLLRVANGAVHFGQGASTFVAQLFGGQNRPRAIDLGRDIRAVRLLAGGASIDELAARLGVKKSMAYQICRSLRERSGCRTTDIFRDYVASIGFRRLGHEVPAWEAVSGRAASELAVATNGDVDR